MEGFNLYKDYFGLIVDDEEGTKIFGFENVSQRRSNLLRIANDGGYFGYVNEGVIRIVEDGEQYDVKEGHFFSTKNGLNALPISLRYRLVVWQKKNHEGQFTIGKWEPEGRLNYIDGCRDSVLINPIQKGMPCLNALYMPDGVNQTMHIHPSTRSGFIIKGGAKCETPKGTYDLEAGQIFYLQTDTEHKFRSDHKKDIIMKLIAYHPDSDFGPSNEEHPMVNRTIVDGVSAKDIDEIRTK